MDRRRLASEAIDRPLRRFEDLQKVVYSVNSGDQTPEDQQALRSRRRISHGGHGNKRGMPEHFGA